MSEPKRIGPQQVREKKEAGDEVMLVCAYDDDKKFSENHLRGAISLNAFQHRLDTIDKNREIVFY